MPSNTPPSGTQAVQDPRRVAILDAAGAALLRFGFRKASVDDVARQAGISRQGLYLHFAAKDELFAGAIQHLLARSIAAVRAALTAPDRPFVDRVLEAFAALTGDALVDRLDEVLETAERLTGRTARELEGEIIAEFVRAFADTPATSPWRRHGDDAEAVARGLYATSRGLKGIATSVPDYLGHMQRTIRFVCEP